MVLSEGFGVGIFSRYVFKGKGIWSVKSNHIVHLAGTAIEFAAFSVTRALDKGVMEVMWTKKIQGKVPSCENSDRSAEMMKR